MERASAGAALCVWPTNATVKGQGVDEHWIGACPFAMSIEPSVSRCKTCCLVISYVQHRRVLAGDLLAGKQCIIF